MDSTTPRKIKIAHRAQGGPNAIRAMFGFAGTLNAERAKAGKAPLLSLGIGAPHM